MSFLGSPRPQGDRHPISHEGLELLPSFRDFRLVIHTSKCSRKKISRLKQDIPLAVFSLELWVREQIGAKSSIEISLQFRSELRTPMLIHRHVDVGRTTGDAVVKRTREKLDEALLEP